MSSSTFDVAVVGAGPAGTTAALLLARRGFKVVLLERGEYPGAKNMFGGVLHGKVLEQIIPGFWNQAPVERFVRRKAISLLSGDSFVSMDFNTSFCKEPLYNGIVVRRTSFDQWYAREAVKAGAVLLNRTMIDGVIMEGNQVVGVRALRPRGEIRARVVIAADGVLSRLAQKAGLRRELKPEHFSLGVKEVIQLPPGAVEERFSLNGEEGMSSEFLGMVGSKLPGGAFLYTNRESLSVGVVIRTHSLKAGKAAIYEALDQFKRHPAIAPNLAGGRFLEYSAHLIPEGGFNHIPKMYTGGMLVTGDAAGLVLASGVFLEGVNLAIASGRLAAETTMEAFEKGNFDQRSMARYEEKLKGSFVFRDLQRYKGAAAMLLNQRLYEFYPSFVCNTLERWFASEGDGHPKLAAIVKNLLKEEVGLWQAAKDGYQMGRAMVW